MAAIEKILGKIPIMLLAALYAGWLGYDYYNFYKGSDSQLKAAQSSLKMNEQRMKEEEKKLVEAEAFYKNLDTLRARIRQLTAQLENTKAVLSGDIDLANFVRMITLEAKKLRLNIKGIRPETEVRKDYYVEVPFTVQMKGAYVQILVFMDRLAKLQQVVRVSDFEMRPSGNVFTKYVELDGSVKIVAYKYLGTSADEIAKKPDISSMKGGVN